MRFVSVIVSMALSLLFAPCVGACHIVSIQQRAVFVPQVIQSFAVQSYAAPACASVQVQAAPEVLAAPAPVCQQAYSFQSYAAPAFFVAPLVFSTIQVPAFAYSNSFAFNRSFSSFANVNVNVRERARFQRAVRQKQVIRTRSVQRIR